MKQIFVVFLGMLLLAPLTGCIKTVDGQVKPGVPLLKDKIESRYERPPEEIFDAAKEVIAYNGVVNREDRINRTIEGRVSNRIVRIRVDEEDASLAKVTVQVRTKAGGADIAWASEIDKQIALRLK